MVCIVHLVLLNLLEPTLNPADLFLKIFVVGFFDKNVEYLVGFRCDWNLFD